jgi:ParB-like chromosome segregation protein Spo0J
VVIPSDKDKDGVYVLEGGHRLGALHILKAKSFPALVVIDTEEVAQ